jgi:hypothetical protein
MTKPHGRRRSLPESTKRSAGPLAKGAHNLRPLTAPEDPMDDIQRRAAEAEETLMTCAELAAKRQTNRWSVAGISDLCDEEFTAQLADRIDDLRRRSLQYDRIGLVPIIDPTPAIDLFGYGRIPVALEAYDIDGTLRPQSAWFWGHEAAEALGWDPAKFQEWANGERASDLHQQRAADEETGILGWQHLRHIPMGVSVWQGPGDSSEHYVDGVMTGPILSYWCDLWLISLDRVMSLMYASPWGKEWFEASKPMMAHAFNQSGLADKLAEVETFTTRTNSLGETEHVPSGGTLADAIARDREGISEEEARERAFRGPTVPDNGGDHRD